MLPKNYDKKGKFVDLSVLLSKTVISHKVHLAFIAMLEKYYLIPIDSRDIIKAVVEILQQIW
ncbi:MAG TPA: hypothetical protein ACHBX0_13790 [Arsenophonus sp.]